MVHRPLQVDDRTNLHLKNAQNWCDAGFQHRLDAEPAFGR
jgi:hypothetical protein